MYWQTCQRAGFPTGRLRQRQEAEAGNVWSLLHQCLAALSTCWPAGSRGTLSELKVGLPDLYGCIGTWTMSQPASLNYGRAIHLVCAASSSSALSAAGHSLSRRSTSCWTGRRWRPLPCLLL